MEIRVIKNIITLGIQQVDRENVWHIAFGVDNRYLRFACVTILSIIKNNEKQNICFHVFCDFVNDDDVKKLQEISNDNDKISILCYLVNDDCLKDFPQGHGWNLSIYYRAIAPTILDNQIEKLLYLDADIVCLNDLSDLFKIRLEKEVAAVVKDGTGSATIDKRLDTLGIEKDRYTSYFNSGVMLINVSEYNKQNIWFKFIDVIKRKREVLFFFDQDAFNIVLSKSVRYIENKYNYQNLDKDIKQPCFVHFAGVRKPWFINFDYYYFDAWRRIYHESPWREVALEHKKYVKPSEYRYQSYYYLHKGKYFRAIGNYFFIFSQ